MLAVLSPAGAAQDPAAPSPSPTAYILYAHHHDSDTEELNGWMNTLVTDPTGNDVALGPATPESQPIPDRVYTFTLAPAMAAPFTLDPAGNIVIDAYIGAGGSQGVVQVSTDLTYGGEVVVSGEPVNHPFQQAGTAAYPKVSWTLAPAITEFAPGNDLVWTVTLTGIAVQTVFMSVSPERGSSGVTLPILTGGDAPPGSGGSNTTTDSETSTSSSSTSSSSTSTSSSSTSTSTTTTSSSSTSRSTTTNATNGDEEDTPAPPMALAGLAIVAAAFVMRRRLR